MNQKRMNKLYLVSFLMGLGLASMAEAHENCGASAAESESSSAWEERNDSFVPAQMAAQQAPRLKPVCGPAPVLGEIVRNTDHSIRLMNFDEATAYCSTHGGLPTPRQFAQLSISLGSAGIRETSHPGSLASDGAVTTEINQMRGEGYEPIYTRNASGQLVVDFLI